MKINLLSFSFFSFLIGNVSAQNLPKPTKDSVSVFTLGEVTLHGKSKENTFSSVNAEKIETYAKTDVAKALNLLPGVTLSQVGPRNEAMIYVRGFDLRSVPVLIDGIPVYVPYDGYVDLGRFTTFDLSDIQISKGYTSVNYGPNSMGGAINLITRKPERSFELNGASGWQTGGFRTNINAGSNLGKFYIQAGLSKFKRDYIPMSDKYKATKNEDGGHRDNSYSDDEKVSLKVAYKPTEKSEYALTYSYQHGSKGSPIYAGSDTKNGLYAKPRYWQWPKWDKQSVYFLSNTELSSNQFIKTRFFYDQFINKLDSYDDDTYSTISKPYAFVSRYNDYTFGGIVEYGNKIGNIDQINATIQYKQDVHREHNEGDPVQKMSDATFTVAVENQLNITDKFLFLTGVSFNNRSSITAQNYNSSTKLMTDYPNNSNNAFNVQGGLVYNFNKNHSLNLSVARKTRFATTKDRYSYRMGTALPNPDLNAEYAMNYDLSYRNCLLDNTLKLYAAVFKSSIRNTILSVSNVIQDPKTNVWLNQMQNVGKTRNEGFELGVDYQIIPSSLLVGANYTYINRKNITNPSVYLTDVPKNKLFAYVQYSLNDIFSVQVNSEFNSKRYSTTYGTVAGDYTLFNTSARMHVWKYFSVEGGVNNIFDRNYSVVEGYPEAGRNYFANLIYNF